MARHLFIPHPLRQAQSTSQDYTNQERHNVKSLRDLFRSGDGLGFTDFNNALNSSRWKVSDIVEMGSGSQEEMYAFILRDTTNTVEYLFVYAGRDSATSNAELNDYIDWDATTLQKVTTAPSGSIGSDAFVFCVFINPDYVTSSFGRNWSFDNTTEMTYTGGDFEDITAISDPDTDWDSDWFPSGVNAPRGLAFTGVASNENKSMAVVIDDVEDAMLCLVTEAYTNHVSQLGILSKNLFRTNTAGDTYTQGVLWCNATQSASNLALENHFYADGFDNAGVAVDDFALAIDQLFTDENEEVGDNYKWRAISATSPDFDKGWINDSLLIEIGAYNSGASFLARYAHPDSNNPCCRYTNGAAFMWVPNVPAWPFTYNGYGDVGGDVP
jgi:hypothetical protein